MVTGVGIAPSRIRVLVLGAFFVTVAACAGGDVENPSRKTGSGVAVSSSVPVTFPIEIALTPEIAAAAAASSLQSTALDRACDAMVFTEAEQIRRVTEDGSTLAFTLFGSAWIADDSRVETLTVTSGSSCSGTVAMKDPDTEYVFGQYCTGASIAEGRIQQLNRQNGDYETFSPDSNGNIGSVQNRLGETVVLNHLADGELQSVIAPTGEKFNLALDTSSRLLGTVTLAGASTPLHTMMYSTSHGGSYFALGSALDGNLHRDHGWTYGWGPADTGAIEVASEAGPGTPGVLSENTLYFAEPLATNETDVVFTAADGTSKTNQYFFASPFADQSRSNLTGRNLLGACPGCGAGTGSTNFWTTAGNETSIRSTQTPNGFWTVYEDFNHAAVASYAYSLGRPLVINEGCDSPSNCTSGRRTSYTYRGTSSDVASTTRPSAVVSATVTDSREFDGASARETKNHHQGWTAATLSGALDTLATRTTKTSYIAGGVDVSQIDGPYSGTGEPPGEGRKRRRHFLLFTRRKSPRMDGPVHRAPHRP